MTASKSAMTAGALAFAALFGGGVYLLINLSGLTKPYLEKMASEALGVKVAIASLDINLQEKTATAGGITIANPKGFDSKHAVAINSASITLGSLAEKLVTIDKITMNDINVNLNVTENGTNLQTIQKNIAAKSKNAPKIAPEDQTNVIIKQLRFSDMSINATSPFIKLDAPINLGGTSMNNIGTKEGGVPPGTAVAQISSHMMQYFGKQAAQKGLYKGLSSDVLKELGAGQVEQFTKQIGEEINSLKKGLGNLF